MRNRYLLILRSYWNRTVIALCLPAYGMWLLVAVGDLWAGARGAPFGGGDSIWTVGFLFMVGSAMSDHLKEMIVTPRSRVTPDVQRAHLIVAGAIAAALTVVVPMILSIAAGSLDRALMAVVVAVTAFSIGAFLSYWGRAWPFYLLAALMCGGYVMAATAASRLAHEWYPAIEAGAAVLSIACLGVVAFRLSRFNEEMPEYSRRGLDRTWQSSHGDSTTGRAPAIFAIPFRRDLRALGRSTATAREGYWRRGLHWDAAWRTIPSAVIVGVISAAVFLVARFHEIGHTGEFGMLSDAILIGVFPPLLGVLASSPVFARERRPLLTYEFLRPYSRAERIQAIGSIIAASFLLSSLPVLAVPVGASWAKLGGSVTARETIRISLLAVCAIPLVFGLMAGDWSSFGAFVGLFAVLLLYAGALFVAAVGVTPTLDPGIIAAATVVLTAGLIVIRLAYQRWLDYDLE